MKPADPLPSTMNALPPDTDTANEHEGEAVLEADVLAAFAAGQAPEPIDPRLHGKVRRRLLGRIADAETSHLTVPADRHAAAHEAAPETPPWRPFLEGIRIKVLQRSGGVMSYLLEFAPGAVLPPHRHPQDEECIVLEGALRIGTLTLQAGGFHMAKKDALHAPITTLDGAVIYLRGAIPEVDQLI
jgi:ChrR Cupin-like domain